MAYSLRLPPSLDALARDRADFLGISLNGLLCVALDAYLRAPGDPAAASVGAAPVRATPAAVPAALPTAQPAKARADQPVKANMSSGGEWAGFQPQNAAFLEQAREQGTGRKSKKRR